MTTLKAVFVDREASSRALAALTHDDIHLLAVDLVAAKPVAPVEKATADFDNGTEIGGVAGVILAGLGGVTVLALTGGTGLAAAALGVLATATAGGMLGSLIGAVVGGSKDHTLPGQTSPQVLLRFDVDPSEEPRARSVVEHEGGVVLGTIQHA